MPTGCAMHIGTSGWHYKHWLGDFYPEKLPTAKMFSWYTREFNTVEINNSFYRLPEQRTFRRWKELAPPGFIFAVKASRFITHIKRLKDAAEALDLFFARAEPLGGSLGPILFQLPPRWKVNLERLGDFLNLLPPRHHYAIEFRDESWYVNQVYDLLHRSNVAFCIHDWGEMPNPQVLTADFTYIRFHGSGTRYGGLYPERQLQKWADRLRGWESELFAAYVYFNNDIGGHAIRNARSLRTLMGISQTHILPAAS
jgi:uncharacterized protein YecE (DUF72 family)